MSFILHRADTVFEAIELQRETGGKYIAGGTVLMVNLYRGKEQAEHLISLEGISQLYGINLEEDRLIIGAQTTLTEIERSEEARRYANCLWQAACQVGGPQIRNRATIGGNIASAMPSADCITPLLALDATVLIHGKHIYRIPLRELYIGMFQTVLEPWEVIVAVEIPLTEISAFAKVGKRNALSVSCLNMAVVKKQGFRVAVGSASPIPVLCTKTSAVLNEGELTETQLEKACRMILTEIDPIDDRWATASYRKKVCVNALKALIREVQR